MVQVQDVSRRYYFTDDAFLEAMSLYRTGTTLLLKVSISSLKFEVSILIIIFFVFDFLKRNTSLEDSETLSFCMSKRLPLDAHHESKKQTQFY